MEYAIIKTLGVMRAIAGFLYGAFIESSLTKEDFDNSPFKSSFIAAVCGTLALFAAEIVTMFTVRPLGDILVICVLGMAARKKLTGAINAVT